MFTDAVALPNSGANQWFCVSSTRNDPAITDVPNLNPLVVLSLICISGQMYCTAMASHKHVVDSYMLSSPAVLPDQVTPRHRQQIYGYQVVMPYFLQGQKAENPVGLYIHSGALQAAHAAWSDMPQIGLVQALFYPDKTAPRREGKEPERSPFSKEAFHGAAAAVLKDYTLRYDHVACLAVAAKINLSVQFVFNLVCRLHIPHMGCAGEICLQAEVAVGHDRPQSGRWSGSAYCRTTARNSCWCARIAPCFHANRQMP